MIPPLYTTSYSRILLISVWFVIVDGGVEGTLVEIVVRILMKRLFVDNKSTLCVEAFWTPVVANST